MTKPNADELLRHLCSIYPRLDHIVKNKIVSGMSRREAEDLIYHFAIEGGVDNRHTQFILNCLWFFIHSCTLDGVVDYDSL